MSTEKEKRDPVTLYVAVCPFAAYSTAASPTRVAPGKATTWASREAPSVRLYSLMSIAFVPEANPGLLFDSPRPELGSFQSTLKLMRKAA